MPWAKSNPPSPYYMQVLASIGRAYGFSLKTPWADLPAEAQRVILHGTGGKAIALKPAVDEALAMGGCEAVRHCVVYKRTGGKIAWDAKRDVWFHDIADKQATTCEPVAVSAEHPLFILYTSGSTGKPKGVQHSSGGYLLWAKLTMQWVFDAKANDIFSYGSHGSTYGGTPLACRVVSEVIDVIDAENMMATTLSNSAALIEQITSELGSEGVTVRGKGMMLGVVMPEDRGIAFDALVDKARDNHHLIINVAGGTAIRILPPLNMSADETVQIGERLIHLIQSAL
jgi:hypothetical protein